MTSEIGDEGLGYKSTFLAPVRFFREVKVSAIHPPPPTYAISQSSKDPEGIHVEGFYVAGGEGLMHDGKGFLVPVAGDFKDGEDNQVGDFEEVGIAAKGGIGVVLVLVGKKGQVDVGKAMTLEDFSDALLDVAVLLVELVADQGFCIHKAQHTVDMAGIVAQTGGNQQYFGLEGILQTFDQSMPFISWVFQKNPIGKDGLFTPVDEVAAIEVDGRIDGFDAQGRRDQIWVGLQFGQALQIARFVAELYKVAWCDLDRHKVPAPDVLGIFEQAMWDAVALQDGAELGIGTREALVCSEEAGKVDGVALVIGQHGKGF